MIAPVHRLSKKEIVWLGSHRCSAHSHTYLEHYQCYQKEHPDTERIGILDIEASQLTADYGIMLTYAIKDYKTGEMHTNQVQPKDLKKSMDKKLVEQCVQDVKKFDRIVGFYSSGYDMPFIRTRALVHNIHFPEYGIIHQDDLYYIAKGKLRLSRNGLDNVARTILGKSDKTRVEGIHWLRALQGNKKSLKYIMDHNIIDVLETEKIYDKLIGFKRPTRSSI